MKDWIKRTFGSRKPAELLAWETDDSILAFLKRNISDDGFLLEAAHTLPDEKRKDNEIKFAPGLADAMFGGADESEASKSKIRKLSKLISRVAQKGDEQSQSDFYRSISSDEHIIGIIDEFLDNIIELALPVDPYLFEYANKLATKTNQRNSVKFGIAILGLCREKKPISDLKILGLHDEFTVFATIALLNLSEKPVEDLWHLAQRVDGWGKIQLVDRLVAMELTTAIKDWLVLEGYKNSIMHEYLALSCAQKGELNEKLKPAAISPALFAAAGDIIVALMDEGPALGMSGYAEALETIENYIRHASQQQLKIKDYTTLQYLKDYLEQSPETNEVLKKWRQDDLSNALIEINNILNARDWTPEVEEALKSTNDVEYWYGRQAARKLGVALWDTFWNRLAQKPLEAGVWFDVCAEASASQVDQLLEFARNNLPLAELGAGPQDSLGIGENFGKHSALDSVITLLGNYPQKGEDLILVALNSPVTRNRNMAINALVRWKAENWSDAIRTQLEQLHKMEPNEDTKQRLERLLVGDTLE